jgi:hypothetical protein
MLPERGGHEKARGDRSGQQIGAGAGYWHRAPFYSASRTVEPRFRGETADRGQISVIRRVDHGMD